MHFSPRVHLSSAAQWVPGPARPLPRARPAPLREHDRRSTRLPGDPTARPPGQASRRPGCSATRHCPVTDSLSQVTVSGSTVAVIWPSSGSGLPSRVKFIVSSIHNSSCSWCLFGLGLGRRAVSKKFHYSSPPCGTGRSGDSEEPEPARLRLAGAGDTPRHGRIFRCPAPRPLDLSIFI